MSQQNPNFKFQNNINKRNYNQMQSNSINSSSNNDLFIRNQLFKSALKYGGPINQELIIHQNKNVRKSMGYKKTQTDQIFDFNSTEKEKIKDIVENPPEIKEKKETSVDLSNRPERKKITFGQKNTIFNTFSLNVNHINFNNNIKKDNIDSGFKSDKKIIKVENVLKDILSIRKESNKNNIISNNNNSIPKAIQDIQKDINENKEEIKKPRKEINELDNIGGNEDKEEEDDNPSFAPNNNSEFINPFHSSTNGFALFYNNKSNNNIVENPFKEISKHRIENPFKDYKSLNSNNSQNSSNDNNQKVINPFKSTNNNIINPFISSNNNPFSNSSSTSNNNIQIKNPFIQSNNNNNSIQIKNPFIQSKNNNSIFNSNNNSNNSKSTNKISNPFINPFKNPNPNINSNPFITKELIKNPFINVNSNTNIITDNQRKSPNANNFNINTPDNDNGEENINVEEEIKIEKDENKLKNFKEIEYKTNNKFYEGQIENLQYLDREEDKNKYISIGGGVFSLQEENEGGKKRGIFVLRDSSTKNIKIQGIILDKSSVEKSRLKNGLEFIMIKNILAIYSKYNKESLSHETKLTYIRIRIDLSKIDELFNRAKEFFENIKNN